MNYGLCVMAASKIVKIGKVHFDRSGAETDKFEEIASLSVHAVTTLLHNVLWDP